MNLQRVVGRILLTPLITLPMPDKLIAVTRTSSKGSSLRITLPKEIAEKLNISESEHIGFYEVKGEIVVRKIE
jgi:AbrB family looped-hinge helix DNA binding protein